MIWFNKNISLNDLTALGKGNMGEHLGMEWVEIGPDFLKLKMPVDNRTKQPFGILHGGASCVLAETIGSVASSLIINPATSKAVGLEINANHIKAVREDFVIATCVPLHLGNKTHIWDIKIHTESNALVCVSRLTVAILN